MNPVLRLVVVACAASCTNAAALPSNLLVNGNFETGDLSGWTEMQPHYAGAESTVFDRTLGGYPMLAPYAGAHSCGWSRPAGNWVWDNHSSMEPSNGISQEILVEPGTYPVHVSAAFFCHHDRRGEPASNWGCGVRVSIYVDGKDAEPAWRYEFWPREGESFWRYHPRLPNAVGDEPANEITTGTGRLRFEIAWITKWAVNQDICAVDNVRLELGNASGDTYTDPVNAPPVYRSPERIGPTHPGSNAEIFLEPDHYPVGLLPNSVVSADFDGDGSPDIAAANLWSHTISVLRNDGTGRFSPALDVPCGHNPRRVVAADVNTDGRPDLIVSCRGDAMVQTFLADGDGGFSAPVDTPTPASPWRIAVGRLDGDPYPDLVVPNDSENSAHVFPGNGDGTFRHLTRVEGDDMTAAAVIVDFTGRGTGDLVVLSWWDATARVYRNDFPSFTLSQTFDVPWQTESAACADFNADGFLDLVAGGAHSSAVGYYLSDGDGTFEPDSGSFRPRVPTDLCAGFWDRDDIPDVAVTCFDVHELSLWRTKNIWDADVVPADNFRSYAAGYQPRAVVADDFNVDGLPDFAVGAGNDHEVLVYLGRPDGAWTGSTTHFPPDWFPHLRCSAVGDFDKDGDLDVAVALLNGIGQAAVKFMRNDGQETLSAIQPPEYPLPADPTALGAGDFDGDGDDDVVVAAAGIHVYRCYGNMTFGRAVTLEGGTNIVALACLDVDANGTLDLVAAEDDPPALVVYEGNGDGTLEKAAVLPLADSPVAFCVGDLAPAEGPEIALALAQRGKIDVVAFSYGGTPRIVDSIPLDGEWVEIACGDIDGDGRTDIVAADGSMDRLTILYGRPAGGFDSESLPTAGTPVRCVAIADFDDDGRADIACGLRDTRTVMVLMARADRMHEPQYYGCVGQPRALLPAPLWNDGRYDLLCTAEDVPRIQVFANASSPARGGVRRRIFNLAGIASGRCPQPMGPQER